MCSNVVCLACDVGDQISLDVTLAVPVLNTSAPSRRALLARVRSRSLSELVQDGACTVSWQGVA